MACDGDPIECGWEAHVGQLEEVLRQIETTLTTEVYRVPGDPESMTRGDLVLALVRAGLRIGSTAPSDEQEGASNG